MDKSVFNKKRIENIVFIIIELIIALFLAYNIGYTIFFNIFKHTASGLIIKIQMVKQYNPYLAQVTFYNDINQRLDTLNIPFDGFEGPKLYIHKSIEICYSNFFSKIVYYTHADSPKYKDLAQYVIGLLLLIFAILFSIKSLKKKNSRFKNVI